MSAETAREERGGRTGENEARPRATLITRAELDRMLASARQACREARAMRAAAADQRREAAASIARLRATMIEEGLGGDMRAIAVDAKSLDSARELYSALAESNPGLSESCK